MTERKFSDTPALARHMGFWALVLYGVGDMLGSGIYALIGKVAGVVGNAVWLAFAVSMLAAILTALSYASLGSRYPRAAGAAFVAQRAFGRPLLSYGVGLAVAFSGLTSMAVQARAFGGYLTGLLPGLAFPAVLLGFVALLTVINVAGIRESSRVNILCTLIEVAGLLLVVVVGLRFWGGVDYLEFPAATGATEPLHFLLALQGASLAFYSFIGFEDMINVTEEVKQPERIFPKALFCAVGIATLVYLAVSLTVVSVLPHAELAASRQPLVDVLKTAAPGFPSGLLSGIALFAIANTALINFVMGSRMIYGMARDGLLPGFLGRVHRTRRTPHIAILTLAALVCGLMFVAHIADLASATTLLLLSVFAVINVAQFILQRRPGEFDQALKISPVIPVLGAVVCLALIASRIHAAGTNPKPLLLAGALAAAILILYAIKRPEKIINIE